MPPSWEELKDGLAPSTVEWIWVPEGAISSEVGVVRVARELVIGVVVARRVVVLVEERVVVDFGAVDVDVRVGRIVVVEGIRVEEGRDDMSVPPTPLRHVTTGYE